MTLCLINLSLPYGH